MNRVWVGAAVLLLAAAGPERAPGRFTSHAFGLTAVIPPGLSHCPARNAGVGLDQGISLYFTPPKACDPDGPAAAPDEAQLLPQIRLYFTANTAEPGGSPPKTNAELHRVSCGETLMNWPAPMTLLGVAAATCFEHQGDTITLAVGTLYSGSVERPAVPDRRLWVLLQTSAVRYPYDFKIFQAVLRLVTLCRAPDRPAQAPRPRCPASAAPHAAGQ